MEALWSRDGRAPSILAQIIHADKVQNKSVCTTALPGTGKTWSLAIACAMTALPGQRKVTYSTVSDEPVKSVNSCLDELLAGARAALRGIPGDEEARKGSARLDLVTSTPCRPARFPRQSVDDCTHLWQAGGRPSH